MQRWIGIYIHLRVYIGMYTSALCSASGQLPIQTKLAHRLPKNSRTLSRGRQIALANMNDALKRTLLRLYPRILDLLSPRRELLLDEAVEFGRRARPGRQAHFRKALIDRRLVDRLHDFRVQPVDDGLRRTGGREHAGPRHGVEARHGFADGGQIGE